MKKFELTTEFITNFLGTKLFRIKALVEFGKVEKGELGGFVEKEENLDHDGDAWVSGDAMVYGNARVSGNAEVYGDAEVYGNARVYGDAMVYGNARVSGDAWVSGDQMYAAVKGFGSEYRNTTFFITKDGNVCVNCGCFSGTLEQFREKVEETHKDTKYAKEYLMIADLMEMHFKEELEKIKK